MKDRSRKALDQHVARKIIIVDDNIDFADSLADILTINDFEVRTAESGQTALSVIKAFEAQVALIDVRLGQTDGLALISQLQAIRPHLLCVMVTAHAETDSVIQALRQGAYDYLRKPLEVEDLLLKLKQCFDKIALEADKDAAENANQAKSAFLANMSHELRTPLNAILGFTQIMQRDSTLSDAQKQNLDIISKSGNHLLDLINDVLELSKIETGRHQLIVQPYDLEQMLQNIIEMMNNRADKKGITLISNIAPDIPHHIKGDQLKLKQVLINLLSNAIKFTDEGEVILTVNAKPRPSQDPLPDHDCILSFHVQDTGPGIPEDQQDMIFNPFEQAAYNAHTKGGTGLGLAISQEYAHLMGGHITVTSALNEGSLFEFDTHVSICETLPETGMMTESRQIIGIKEGQHLPKILIADDVADSRKLMNNLLTPIGFVTRLATTGKEAVDLWQTWHPDLIWMDIRMPDMDGLEATRQIKSQEDGQHTKIIALSASVFEEDRERVYQAGCDDFVCKPFKEAKIFELIQTHLGTEYIYRSQSAPPAPPHRSEDLVPSDLEGLPETWLQTAKKAALEGDIHRLETLVSEISSEQQKLKQILEHYVQAYAIDDLITLLDKHPCLN